MNREENDAHHDNREEDGGSGGGGANGGDNEPEGELYDLALATVHSYISAGMMPLRGRAVLEPGWQGRVPVMAHHNCVFPGETMPMMMRHANDAVLIAKAIRHNKLFGLLCPDATGNLVSGYGVLCEVFEAGAEEELNDLPKISSFKARALYRFRILNLPKKSVVITSFNRMKLVDVTVLPEVATRDSLCTMRLHSLAPLQAPHHTYTSGGAQARRLEASSSPWPPFVHDIFNYQRLRKSIQDFFTSIKIDKMPDDPVLLSFMVASNLVLSLGDCLALFVVDNALLRLHLAVGFIKRKNTLCCLSCLTEITDRNHVFPMSSEGVTGNYVNLGGHVHDVLTVREVRNVNLSGLPTDEYSWFPGYAWTIATCEHCDSHVGWRFEALKPTLRPQRFYGLCRHNLQPHTRQDAGPADRN
ncbi:unnamed protein product [Arctia plantaginis]|uniref:Protein cereblon n=1 Tax=Arctia plantaginis TaxID=874455 RepID=A0A8S0Z1J3_ARCPL|nr:unnamed protein product [Arctia plantaginis]